MSEFLDNGDIVRVDIEGLGDIVNRYLQGEGEMDSRLMNMLVLKLFAVLSKGRGQAIEAALPEQLDYLIGLEKACKVIPSGPMRVIGTGGPTKTKMVNNLLVALDIAGATRAMALGLGMGLDPALMIPAVAFVPMSSLVFGFGLWLAPTIASHACVWPLLIATLSATRNMNRRLLDVADTLDLPLSRRITRINLPSIIGRSVLRFLIPSTTPWWSWSKFC